jgi:hypothetical protein
MGWTFTEHDKSIGDIIGTMWTNFAKSGDPNKPLRVPGDSLWTPLNSDHPWRHMSINYLPKMLDGYHPEDVKLWNDIITPIIDHYDAN